MPEPRASGASPPWTAWALRLAIVAIPAWLTVPILFSNVDLPIKALIAIVLGVTLINPVHGLLLIAFVTPLAELIAPVIGSRNWRIAESIVMTFLVGWALRSLPDRRGPRIAAPGLAWLWASTIVASIAGLAWQLGRYPGELPYTVDQIEHIYFFITDRIGFNDGARLIEGIGLVVATVALLRRDPRLSARLPLALAGAAVVAAGSSVLLSRGIGSAAALARYQMIGYRISGHIGDVNAAGSYYAMIVCLAAGMALRGRGGTRALWVALGAASGIGLWLTRSRSALGAAGAVMAVAAVWALTAHLRRGARVALLAVVVVALVGGAMLRARLLEADPDYRGVSFRQQFVQTGLRMIEARPLFGVGVGQYYPRSPLFLSPQLAFSYGFENAHNYFLQVGGELGLVGAGLFLAWLIAGLARTGRALAVAPGDVRLLGIGGGVLVFLITCFTGHPFLVAEAAFPFWMQFGLMIGLAGSTLLNAAPGERPAAHTATRRSMMLTAAAAAIILIAMPIATARELPAPPASPAVDGLFEWQRLEDGTRFRWTGDYASLFVPAGVTRVEIPVRLPADGRTVMPMGVEVMAGGNDRGRSIVDATWSMLTIPLPPIAPPQQFTRIDLKVDRVWQPAVYLAGYAEMRHVGIQLGETRMFRD